MRMVLTFLLGVIASVAGCAEADAPPQTPPDTPVVVLVSYERQGGFGGFEDQLVVRTDGSYSFAGSIHSPTSGVLSAAELTNLRGALEFAQLATLPTDSPLQVADGYTHTVRYAGHEVRAGDGNIPARLQPVIELLDQIFRG
jgi:hypothetical protein